MFLLRNPRFNWLILLASLVYLISPFDLLPDILPLLGQADDLVLLVFLIYNLLQNLPKVFTFDQQNNKKEEEDIKTIDVDATTIK
jgi:uncharacterized membrane protein YkvA (DUF1232 family)